VTILALGVASPTIYDSGHVAMAENARAVPKSGVFDYPHEQREYERLTRGLPRQSAEYVPRQAYELDPRFLPRLELETRRGPLVGDLWKPGEFNRLLTGER